MIDILRIPDFVKITCDSDKNDASVRFVIGEGIKVFVSWSVSGVKYVDLRWKFDTETPVSVMSDSWERLYNDAEWGALDSERHLPWYFIAKDGDNIFTCCGVRVLPNSFVCFSYDASGVTCRLDVRCGGMGVKIDGELQAAEILCRNYTDIGAYEACREFCALMSPNPVLPEKPVYGSNNWYYAYGKSSYNEIMNDARLLASLTDGLENRPFMVIDDGWTINSCAGPWLPNDKYGDMKKIAGEFKALGVRPGIWMRPLHDIQAEKEHPEWLINRADCRFLDPTIPEVKRKIAEDVSRIYTWGYELIKHDFSTFDLFGRFGFEMNSLVTKEDSWAFNDRHKTSAQVVKELYKVIRDNAENAVIIGCNTIGHLCAGIFELNRTGDDTSGERWARTRKYGVNSLAFRMCQNKTFYMCDADCVGILDKNIPWSLNRQWLDLLAKSGTPLFVSAQPEVMTAEIREDLKNAFKTASKQEDETFPVDFEFNKHPRIWSINGETVKYDFYMSDGWDVQTER